MTWKAAAAWSLLWISLSLAFGAGVYHHFGPEAGTAFFTGYLVEKALSIDNLFVFTLIFKHFGVPPAWRGKVLSWGLLGALVMRAVFVLAGTALITRFHAALYAFGALLLIAALRMLVKAWRPAAPHQPGWMMRRLDRLVTQEDGTPSGRFFVRVAGQWRLTTLMAALVAVEVADIVFAVDSVPAVLAISHDPFIVYTSNIGAILGLRSLYFLLAELLERLPGIDFGLALILGFVGGKMLLADVYPVSTGVSLAVIGGTIAVCAAFGLWRRPRRRAPA